MPRFVQDVEEIRQRAIQKIEEGAVTSTYGLDQERVIAVLNEALATEIVCVLRYQHHYFMATGVHGRMAAEEFKEHADEEREHADKLAERIQQLGGKPDFNPRTLLERSVAQYVEGESLADMIREDLIAERVVIDVYREMIKFFGDADPTTRILLEHLLEDEEEHASDLADLLYVVNPRTGETAMQDPGTQIGQGGQQQSELVRDDRQAELQLHQEEARAERDQGRDAEEAREAIGNIREGQQREQRRIQPQVTNATQPKAGDEIPDDRNKQNRRGNRQLQEEPEMEANERGGRRDRGEARPARSTGQQRPGSGRRDVQPAHAPGTTGRVMARRGRNNVAPTDDDIEISGQSGTNRSPKILQKNRKKRAA
ncbi:MAG TPA: ferritin-like domain-containing protein [Terriglobales bacterium]|nr:ferritin-like domain-containing protein [Terriglobales bacterium]